MLVSIGIVCGGTSAYIAAMMLVLRRSKVCPACGKRRVTGTQHFRKTVIVDGHREGVTESRYRCEACGATFAQRNEGPLIPSAAWDEGVRELPPPARALPPRTPS